METPKFHLLGDLQKEHPDRFIECYIAEQNMVSIAVGCATRNRTVPFCSTFCSLLHTGL